MQEPKRRDDSRKYLIGAHLQAVPCAPTMILRRLTFRPAAERRREASEHMYDQKHSPFPQTGDGIKFANEDTKSLPCQNYLAFPRAGIARLGLAAFPLPRAGTVEGSQASAMGGAKLAEGSNPDPHRTSTGLAKALDGLMLYNTNHDTESIYICIVSAGYCGRHGIAPSHNTRHFASPSNWHLSSSTAILRSTWMKGRRMPFVNPAGARSRVKPDRVSETLALLAGG